MSLRPIQPAASSSGMLTPAQSPISQQGAHHSHPSVLKRRACIGCYERKVKCDRTGPPCTNCVAWSAKCQFPSAIRKCKRKRSAAKKDATMTADSDAIVVTEALDTSPLPNGSSSSENVIGAEVSIERLFEILQLQGHRTVRVELLPNEGGMRLLPALASTQLQPVPSTNQDLSNLYLTSPSSASLCWNAFISRVDPLVKIVHLPTASPIFFKPLERGATLGKIESPLVLAMYLFSLASMNEAQVHKVTGMPKSSTIHRYRSATESALVSAGILTTGTAAADLFLLQALALFLAFSHFTETTSDLSWALTGLAKRLVLGGDFNKISATNSLGNGKDDQQPLSPFETEMRRRIWWQLWYLDQRAGDDKGAPAPDGNIALEPDLPLNIDDTALHPLMASLPPNSPRQWTQISYVLLRLEIAHTSRLMDLPLTQAEKLRLIDECEQRLNAKYLAFCGDDDGDEEIGDGESEGDALPWLVRHVSLILIAEMRCKVYSESEQAEAEAGTSQPRRSLFDTALFILAAPTTLRYHHHARHWYWIVGSYSQSIPLVFVLGELALRAHDNSLDHRSAAQAWAIVKTSLRRWGSKDEDRIGEGWEEAMRRNGSGREILRYLERASAAWPGYM